MLTLDSTDTHRGTSPAQRACPVCDGRTSDFFHLPRLPIDVGIVHDSAESALRAATGQVTLAHCRVCGFVFNRTFEPQAVNLEPGYEVQLVHSAIFREFLVSLTARLVDKYDLRGKQLLDAGCGAGHFLRMLCEAGGNRGLGIDPTVPTEGRVPLRHGEMHLVRGKFSAELSSRWQADFAVCQSVLENVDNPVRFLSGVAQTLKSRQGHGYFEVFNAVRAFAAGEVWSLTYEQCNYYSLEAFCNMIRRAGFEILESGVCYGDGQYLYVEAATARAVTPPPLTTDRPVAIERFAHMHQERLALWQQRIAGFRSGGQKAAVWGTGGKGVCFLNTVGAADVFHWAVDINPDRQNRYVPGSGQLIVGPAQLRNLRPDFIVITNPLYESEIRSAAAELDLNCEFLTI